MSSTHQRSKVDRMRVAAAIATTPSTSAYAAMKAVRTTTVAPGHMTASTPKRIAARPPSKNSHQWGRVDTAIGAAVIVDSSALDGAEGVGWRQSPIWKLK